MRFGMSSVFLAAFASAFLIATRARADIKIYEKEGWSVYTRGLIAAHYQIGVGDADPAGKDGRGLIGGKFTDEGVKDSRDNSVLLSRVRSGFVGSQLGLGVNRRISDSVNVTSLVAISVNDVSSSRGQDAFKSADFREAWAAIATPFGTLKVGRMFSIFGSASGQVVLMAFRYGLGNPCSEDDNHPTLACGSVGAGYAGFDAQFRYITPPILAFDGPGASSPGLQLQVSASDPIRPPAFYFMTPFPRVDGEINYGINFGDVLKLRVVGQGVWEEIQALNPDKATIKRAEVWGAMGSGFVDVGGAWGTVSLGAGGWSGAGIGVHTLLEGGSDNGASPLCFGGDNSELRIFRGYYGNLVYAFHGSALAVGAGIVYVKPIVLSQPVPTAANPMPPKANDDTNSTNYTLLTQQAEGHIVFSQAIDAVVITAEYMRWNSQWYFGEKRDINFGGVGANYFW